VDRTGWIKQDQENRYKSYIYTSEKKIILKTLVDSLVSCSFATGLASRQSGRNLLSSLPCTAVGGTPPVSTREMELLVMNSSRFPFIKYEVGKI
tara:strand:+ start:61 stop:342 length:282 start_codon:yes stop_codon:yes gene_type:complete